MCASHHMSTLSRMDGLCFPILEPWSHFEIILTQKKWTCPQAQEKNDFMVLLFGGMFSKISKEPFYWLLQYLGNTHNLYIYIIIYIHIYIYIYIIYITWDGSKFLHVLTIPYLEGWTSIYHLLGVNRRVPGFWPIAKLNENRLEWYQLNWNDINPEPSNNNNAQAFDLKTHNHQFFVGHSRSLGRLIPEVMTQNNSRDEPDCGSLPIWERDFPWSTLHPRIPTLSCWV